MNHLKTELVTSLGSSKTADRGCSFDDLRILWFAYFPSGT